MQPILASSFAAAAAPTVTSTSTRPRRGGVVSYVDPGSGDGIPDAGEVFLGGSDFIVSGAVPCVQRMGLACMLWAHLLSPQQAQRLARIYIKVISA